MDLLKTILLYLSMLYISSVQIAPDPSTVNVTPTPVPTPYGIVATATPVPTPTPTPVPTPAITPNSTYGQMIMGDRDETVAELQRKLQELGYYKGEIDGAYGNQTRRAVEQFQYQNGLTVDGIAGKYTLTVLYESDEVKPAPTQAVATNTPAFQPDETVTPPPATETPARTPLPAPTVTPAPTAAPEPTDTPETTAATEPADTPEATATPKPTNTPEPTDTPEPSVTPDLSAPLLMEPYHFVLSGFTDPLTVQDSHILLHPVESDGALYVPLLEILLNAGNVVIRNADGDTEEIAFSVLSDFYQVSYTPGEDGSPSDFTMEKNAQPQPLNTRNAILLDNILYLPLEDVARITGIAFTMDEAGGTVTVTMPAAG